MLPFGISPNPMMLPSCDFIVILFWITTPLQIKEFSIKQFSPITTLSQIEHPKILVFFPILQSDPIEDLKIVTSSKSLVPFPIKLFPDKFPCKDLSTSEAI